jgi:ferredoxin
MAYQIDSDCTACGECLAKCPNDAIGGGTSIYHVEPLMCTECVGYAEEPQCVKICPEDAIHLAPSAWGFLGTVAESAARTR